MQLATWQPLFPWDALEDSPSLGTLKRFLAAIPDDPLLDSLRQARGHGCHDHPVVVLWGVGRHRKRLRLLFAGVSPMMKEAGACEPALRPRHAGQPCPYFEARQS